MSVFGVRGAQDSISLMKIEQERRGRPRTRVQPGMLSNEYGMLACVAHVHANDVVYNQDVEGEATAWADALSRSPARAHASSASLTPVSLPRPRTPVDNPADMALKVQEVLEFTAAPATVVIPVGGHDLGAVESRESGTVTRAVESRESVVRGHRIDAARPFGAGEGTWGAGDGGGVGGYEQRAGSVQNSGAGAGARAVAGSGVGLGVVAKGAEKASIDNVSIHKPSIDMAPIHKPCTVPDHPHKAPMVPDWPGVRDEPSQPPLGELSTGGQGDPDGAALARVDSGQCLGVTAVSIGMCHVSHAFRVIWPQP